MGLARARLARWLGLRCGEGACQRPEPPTLSSQLRVWERILRGEGHRNLFLVTLYVAAPWAYPPAMACLGVRMAASPDVPELLRSVCGLFTMYSSGAAAFLWGFRRQRLQRVLAAARGLSERAELGGLAEPTQRTARWLRWLRVNGFLYIKTGSLMAAAEQFSDSPAIPICYDFEALPARVAMALAEGAKWGVMATCFFSMWLFIVTLLMTMEAHYEVLCARLQQARGRSQVVSCSQYLNEISKLEGDVRELFYEVLLHMLAGALLVPLINTYQLLFGPRNLFSVLTLSTMPLVYGSMSVLGDRLAVGCEKVSLAAYSGPWTEETPSEARLRLMLIQCCTRPAPFAMKGLGGFTRASAYRVLKTWYQYLNLLISSITSSAQ